MILRITVQERCWVSGSLCKNDVQVIGCIRCDINTCVCAIVVCAQEDFNEMEAFMSRGQADGWLRPVIGREYPLHQAADAHVEVIEHKTTRGGKIVLSML